MGQPVPRPPLQPHLEAPTLVLRLLSEEMVEALLARLRLLRGLPSSIEGGWRGREGASLQLTRLGTEPRSGARRSEETAEKEPVVWGRGAGRGPAWPRIPRVMPREVGVTGSCGEGAAVCGPRQRIGAPLFLPSPPPHTHNSQEFDPCCA